MEESSCQSHQEVTLELNDENSWVNVWDESSMWRKEQGHCLGRGQAREAGV